MANSTLKTGFVYFVMTFFFLSTVPCQAAPRPPVSDVKIATDNWSDAGSCGDPLIEAGPLEGADFEMALAWATSDEAFAAARMELTSGRDLNQDLSGAVAFRGSYGPEGKEVEVVIVPFPDGKRPDEKAGFIAVARSGSKTAASCCIIERAAAPSEAGSVSLELPVEDPLSGKTWIWVPEEGISGEKARQYFKCVTRNTVIGCSLCMGRCVVSVMFFMECMKYCCAGAFALAVISCAVEMIVG